MFNRRQKAMTSHSSSSPSSAELVQKLVSLILGKPTDAVKTQYRFALQVLNCSFSNHVIDEFSLCEQIKKKFVQENRVKDALTFVELHRKLQSSEVLKNRANVLHFLHCLFGSERDNKTFSQLHSQITFSKLESLDAELALNTPDVINKHINKSLSNTVDLGDFFIKSENKDGIVDSHFSKYSNKSAGCKDNLESIEARIARVATMLSANSERDLTLPNVKCDQTAVKALGSRSEESNLGSLCYNLPNIRLLLRDILYVLQGLRGDVIYWVPDVTTNFTEFNVDLPNPVKRLALRFLELGWMYHQINQFCEVDSRSLSPGLLAQSFVAALKSKLVDYYKLIAELEALLIQETTLEHTYSASNALTLHRLSVWLFEPHTQLKILASVVNACNGKKGGAIASVLYSHLQHGDNYVRALIQNLLRDVTRPLFKMLSNWIYCGELDDAYGEFFVAANTTGSDANLWNEKYSLNKAMIPSFINMDQARKILLTGKAINFLRQVCHDNTFAKDEDRRMKALEMLSTESLFSQEKDANFENILEKNYLKTSKTVLQVLHEKYNLMDHLMAMRNYFLLGQGDFIRHLMDLLETDLSKPGKNLYIHNLTGILESAIRATNAQFHNPEVLQRLDVRLLEVCLDDTGWDVFSLDYHVDGPIATVFTSHCMHSYYKLFHVLWKAKRMEYILCKISHSRSSYSKYQAQIPEITPVLYQCHIILAQMIHFVQQIQYYMAFEVMECCWADLQLKIGSAKDLDQVIAAHESFLDTLITRSLLDEENSHLQEQLVGIYSQIVEFDKIQDAFWKRVKIAATKMDEMTEMIETKTSKNEWGLTESQKLEYLKPLNHLKTDVIPKTKAILRILSINYEDFVQKFLITLNDQNDTNLRFLSFRLDFNEHFKNKNSRLQTSLTYQNRRKSIK
ncbi:gamma-tubulin complex component 3 homolog [Argiope bruennichi]|uniref:Gamma-tubulin complex component 3 like protein n=1 Tax=Argiope bruennichi TaxID=94029 RepID=A0A8T0EW83_ARGBR|nr:gamma-tubulin complex component 3 homolog [Argiope bruennichi]KAF8778289.1 Gamma-tubulin complex component 3 like protein [Argiope bruennichi]